MSVEKSPNQWKLPAWVAFTLGGLALMTYGIFREHQARELTESRVDIIPPTKSAQLAMMKTNLSGVSINPTDVNTGIIVAGWLAQVLDYL